MQIEQDAEGIFLTLFFNPDGSEQCFILKSPDLKKKKKKLLFPDDKTQLL